jgi:hypothetical protein
MLVPGGRIDRAFHIATLASDDMEAAVFELSVDDPFVEPPPEDGGDEPAALPKGDGDDQDIEIAVDDMLRQRMPDSDHQMNGSRAESRAESSDEDDDEPDSDAEEFERREALIDALRREAAELRDWKAMTDRASAKLRQLAERRLRGRPLSDTRTAEEIEAARETDAVKELEIARSGHTVGVHFDLWTWNPLPAALLRSVVASSGPRTRIGSSILEPWSVFQSMYPDSALPRLARRLFAIPASEAEAERTIKIMRAVLGRFSGQMSNRVLVARVRIAMDCYQRRQASRRTAQSAGMTFKRQRIIPPTTEVRMMELADE